MEMPEFSNPLPDHLDFSESKLFSKKNVMTFLVIAIGLLVIPFSVKMLEQVNIIQIKATGDEISFVEGENIDCTTGNTCKAIGTRFQVLLKSPLGPPGTPVPTQPPTSTPGPTATLGPATPTPIATPTPPVTPAPPQGGWQCNANYVLSPALPEPNTNVTITFSSIQSPNIACLNLLQDGVIQDCRLVDPNNTLSCGVNSGVANSWHILQLKYGQVSSYPSGTNCGSGPVDCNPLLYQTK